MHHAVLVASQPTLKQLLIAMLPLQHLRFKGSDQLCRRDLRPAGR